MTGISTTVGVLVGSMLLAGLVGHAIAGEPLEKIRQTVNEILVILGDEALLTPERTQERRARLRQAVLKRFGFQEMAQRALGRHWRKLSASQQKEFVALFSDLLERSYVGKFEQNRTGNEVAYTREKIDDNGRAMVHSEITTQNFEPFEVEYRLLLRQGNWEVYDVLIEGVSLVNNYRLQFNKIIHQESYDALVKKMQLKLEQEEAVSGRY